MVFLLISKLSSVVLDVMLFGRSDVIRLVAQAWRLPNPSYLLLTASHYNFYDNQQQLGYQK